MTALLTWLDSSAHRYHAVATLGALLALALALAPWCAGRLAHRLSRPFWFGFALLFALLAFRWPVVLDNRQLPNPDESQMLAGALTLAHRPVFWLHVDGTTHGPLAQWPLTPLAWVYSTIDYTAARLFATLLAWGGLICTWLTLRHWTDERTARLGVLPALALLAFTIHFDFLQYSSEHVPMFLNAAGLALVATAFHRDGTLIHRRRLLASGLVLGLVPWAKLQAVPVAGTVGLLAVWACLMQPAATWSARGRTVAALAALALVPAVLILVYVAAHGIVAEFWQLYVVNNLFYAGGRWFGWTEAPKMFLVIGAQAESFLAFFHPVAIVTLLGLPFAVAAGRPSRRALGWSVLIVAAALFAVMAPGRLFQHYLQLCMLPLALVFGATLGGVLNLVRRIPQPAFRAICVATVATLVMIATLTPLTLRRVEQGSGPSLGRFALMQGARVRSPVALELRRHAAPGETLGHWGWMPNFYVETGLVQATRDGHTSRQIHAAPDRDAYRARFLAEIRQSFPPVFVDAVGPQNFSLHDRETMAHETFPALRDFIRQHYTLIADIDSTRVYVRNDRLSAR